MISITSLIAINFITFVVYAIDKYKARHRLWRIPEAALLLLAVFGGSIGAYLAMQIFRHKTLHFKFKYGIPLIFIIQAAMLYFAAS